MKRLLLLIAALLAAPSAAWAGNPYTAIGDAAYTATASDVRLVPTVALTATRVITLPYAGATVVGSGTSIAGGIAASGLATDRFEIVDVFGNVGPTNCLTVTAQTGDLLNGVSGGTSTFCNPFGRIVLRPVGGTGWQIDSGEVQVGTTLIGATVSVTTATPVNIVGQASHTISIGPGDWDCRATVARVFASGTTSYTILSALLSSTSTAAAPSTAQLAAGQGAYLESAANVSTSAIGPLQTIGPFRFSVTAATPLYLAVTDTFSAGTDTAYGNITCRRAL